MNDNLTPMEAEERPTLRKEILLEACRAQCLFCADKAETIWDGKMNPYGKGDINPDPVKLERQYVPNCGEMEGWAHHRSFGGFSECSAGNIRDLLAATPVALPEDFGITKPQPKVEGMGALTAEDMRGFSDEEVASFVCDEVYTPVAPEVTQQKAFTEVEMFEATTKAFVKGIAEGRKLAMKEFQEEASEDARFVDLREGFER